MGRREDAEAGWGTAAVTAAAMLAFAANSLLCRAALGGGHADAATFTTLRLAAGALALFAYALGFSLAYRLVSMGVGALLLFAAVQLTMVVVGLRTGERPCVLEWAGHALSVAGLVALTRPGLARPDPVGATLMILAGAAWGVYSLRGRSVGHAVGRNAANFSRAVPLALAASAIGASFGPIRVDPLGAGLALVSGAVASGMGYALWNATQRDVRGRTECANPHLTAGASSGRRCKPPWRIAIVNGCSGRYAGRASIS